MNSFRTNEYRYYKKIETKIPEDANILLIVKNDVAWGYNNLNHYFYPKKVYRSPLAINDTSIDESDDWLEELSDDWLTERNISFIAFYGFNKQVYNLPGGYYVN